MFGIDDALIGGIASGVLGGAGNILAQNSANQMNMELQKDAQAYNTEAASRAEGWARQARMDQMVFQREMSNSAYQRQVADMKAAGLNPMMAMMKGGGASSPPGAGGSAQSSPSPLTRVESNRAGDAIRGVLSSALETATVNAGLKKTSAETALSTAAALTEAAKARKETVSAKTQEAGLKAAIKRGEVDAKQADIDKTMLEYDNVTKRIGQALGIGNSAKDLVNPLKLLPRQYRGKTIPYNPHGLTGPGKYHLP